MRPAAARSLRMSEGDSELADIGRARRPQLRPRCRRQVASKKRDEKKDSSQSTTFFEASYSSFARPIVHALLIFSVSSSLLYFLSLPQLLPPLLI